MFFINVKKMTLSNQLEALTKSDRNIGMNTKKEKDNDYEKKSEYSFIRRKLIQLRSGRWRREKSPLASDGLTRSLSMSRVDIVKREFIWGGSSLPSLDENSTRESCEQSKQSTPSTPSASPPVQHRKPKDESSDRPLKSRPQSYAGLEFNHLENAFVPAVTKPASLDLLPIIRDTSSKLVRRGSHHESKSRSISHLLHKRFFALYEGRSRSLTQMEALEPETVFREESPRLVVPPLQARRKQLARSQVSSSEYFSVSFELGSGNKEEEADEFVVAAKGTSLAEALSSVCSRRGIDLTDVNIYLESCKNPPLPPLTTETSWLGGKHIVIKSKDDKKEKSQSAKSSGSQFSLGKHQGSYRRKSGSKFFSASTEETSCNDTIEINKTGGKSRQRWSGLFSNAKDTKMEVLAEQLNNYSKHGIPHLPDTVEDLEEALYNLEEDWRDLMKDANLLPERVQQQQTAIWELIQTELAYIRSLKVVNDFFLSCLTSLQSGNILTEIDKAKLFSNIGEIYLANRGFWCQYMLPMLVTARRTCQPLNPHLLLDGFFKFEEIFRPYTKYCAEQSSCQQYCREKHQENELFTTYLVWCETQKGCNRLGLMDILVKPMQRLTKYSLLLKAIQKHTEIEEHRLSLELMIRHVDMFVNSVNTTLKQKQDMERLRGVIARIEAYDVVESKDEDLERLVRSYNELDLTCPMPGCCNSQRRHLLLESDLRLKDSNTSKIDVHCFLFTDMLLICKPATRRSEGKVRVLRQPFLVERLVVQELSREHPTLALVYLTEYRVPCAAFLLMSSDTKLIKNWLSAIKKAQDLYASAKRATAGSSHSILALSRQPSSFYDDDVAEDNDYDSHSVASLGLFPIRSPRGSTRGSSLNQSHSGSVEMEGGSSVSSMSQSRGVSVENEIRGSSQSSDEGIPPLNHEKSPPRTDRRKCASPNTLSIQVPVFSSLGQSLPDLNQVSYSTTSASSNSGMLLVPPRGSPHRGTSYPPPSPPLRRAPALTLSRNPPLLKTRHVGSTSSSLATTSCDVDIPVIAGVSPDSPSDTQNHRLSALKRNARSCNNRYHTASIVDDLKKQDTRDTSIQKRRSWNCAVGPSPEIVGTNQSSNDLLTPSGSQAQGQTITLNNESIISTSGISCKSGSIASNLDQFSHDTASSLSTRLGATFDGNEEVAASSTVSSISPSSPVPEKNQSAKTPIVTNSSPTQLAEMILNDPYLESSDV
ncbi:uncharacterized protein LOC142319765 isoform X3 [Lycorma delicatula]|uniref:uncharacterized protein LOC142319765 isoform X3 n=1 Tax=Lycorma delicatula TaxID=130591 RepID=UPI003F518010